MLLKLFNIVHSTVLLYLICITVHIKISGNCSGFRRASNLSEVCLCIAQNQNSSLVYTFFFNNMRKIMNMNYPFCSSAFSVLVDISMCGGQSWPYG